MTEAKPETTFMVRFFDVGRDKKKWEERISRPVTAQKLQKAVRASGALMSRVIEVSDDDDWGGCIFAGFRTVGRYLIVPGSEGVQ